MRNKFVIMTLLLVLLCVGCAASSYTAVINTENMTEGTIYLEPGMKLVDVDIACADGGYIVHHTFLLKPMNENDEAETYYYVENGYKHKIVEVKE